MATLTAPAPRPPVYDAQLLADAAARRAHDAVLFRREGRTADAAKAELDAGFLRTHAKYADLDAAARRPRPPSREATVRFARAVLAAGGER